MWTCGPSSGVPSFTAPPDGATQDPHGSLWCRQQFKDALNAGPVLINVIVYGEIAFACERIEEVDEILCRPT